MGGLLLATTGPATAADDRSPAAAPPGSTATAKLPDPAPGSATQAARLKAKSTGKPVTIDELTTETSLTVAEPNGKLTVTTHLQTARIKRNGGWADLDARLRKNGDGTWSPEATPSGVTLSGGGTGPLATLTDRDGKSLAVSFPMRLPKPVVQDSKALYPNVLPGVDLQVDVTDQGAVREVLVVKDAKAAANPALKSLRLATSTKGLTVTTEADGSLTAKTADGRAAFISPTPVMWDSATTATAPASVLSSEARSKAAAESRSGGQTVTGPSTADGPGQGSRVRPIGVRADRDAITLVPDAELLGGKDTVWPLFIDPPFQPLPTMGTNHYAQVKRGCPSTPLYDKPQDRGQGVGFQHYDSDCYGMYRSYFELNTTYLKPNMYIDNAKVTFTETYGADWNCNTPYSITLKWTGAIGGGTDWNHQPGVIGDVDTKQTTSASPNGGCGWKTYNFDATDEVRSLAQQDADNWTVGLFGDEGGDVNKHGFMRFGPNPSLSVTYDIAPNTPDSQYIDPWPINPGGYGCNGSQPGWVGRTVLTGNGNSDITLHAWGSTPMPNTNITLGFHVWDNMTDGGNGQPYTTGWPPSQTINGAGWGNANISIPVSDGHQYGWNAWATDGLLNSPTSGDCHFNVDTSPPSLAQFGNMQAFPPLGSGIKPTGHAGDQGTTIKVSSTDPTPGGCNRQSCIKSGVWGFRYSLDDNVPVTGGNTAWATQNADGSASADIPVQLNPDQWGTHRLYVRAFDAAGNTQPEAAVYDFYAPWNPATKVVAGDLDYDGTPDLVVPAADGSLTLLPGNSDFTAQPGTASTQAHSPEGDSWNNYLIAHRGSTIDSSVDDLFAYNKGTRKLYLYRNDASHVPQGTAGHFNLTAGVSQIYNSTSLCHPTRPGATSNITQMTALSPTPAVSGRPNLVTVEDGHLWYYRANTLAGCMLEEGQDIGTGDWSGVTLLSPGLVGGQLSVWARDNVTGAVHSYPLNLGTDGKPTNTLPAPTRSTLVSAVSSAQGQPMCADIDYGRTDNGTLAQLWDCNTSSAQILSRATDGAVHILGKCLDINQGTTYNGSIVQLWDCNGSGAQKWVDGPYAGTLQNPQSGRCLAVPNASNTPGTKLTIWDCLSDASQRWVRPAQQAVLVPGLSSAAFPGLESPGDINGDGNPDLIATAAQGTMYQFLGTQPSNGLAQFGSPRSLPTAAPAVYNIASMHGAGRCLDNWGAQNGADLRLYDCWNGPGQKFTFATDGTLRTGGRCVSTKDNALGWGTTATITDCTGAGGQIWTYRTDGSLYNPAGNVCLELPGMQDANALIVGVWGCANYNHHRWNLFRTTL
ncbi:ricin-type beta-trefoil lectin domain protein [Kitasatospora sp. NPDC002040]|uniref:ricin-type beta-trefoil lectin domain protein n=1 Tax=Kitasatospora sp. NPDC002040 TaxID=3154661 RepID=UPI003327FBDD